MKNFKVTGVVGLDNMCNSILGSVIVKANDKVEASYLGRQALGREIRGKFFPLHWSEIKEIELI